MMDEMLGPLPRAIYLARLHMLPFYWNYRVNRAFENFKIKLKRVILKNENMILGSKNKNITLEKNELEI